MRAVGSPADRGRARTSIGEIAVVVTTRSNAGTAVRRRGRDGLHRRGDRRADRASRSMRPRPAGGRGSSSTATSGRSSPRTASPATGPTRTSARPTSGSTTATSALAKEAIVPGKPDESELVARIFSDDADEVMPPPESHKKLTAAQKELLKRWIAAGGRVPAALGLRRRRRARRARRSSERGWVRNPIDAFILEHARSRRASRPSPEADRRTLIRRLSLDLIGLPPTPEEVDAFVDDTRPGRLRAAGRPAARLARTTASGWPSPGSTSSGSPTRSATTATRTSTIFPYRDYVIDAFNHNKPFDQFTIEQLAGDLLPNPTTEQLVATGFNRLNMMTREGGAQPKEYLAKYAADRVRTVGDHLARLDAGLLRVPRPQVRPVHARRTSTRSAAFFADVKQWGVYTDYDYTPNPDLKGWTNDHPFPPEIEVDSPYLKRRQEQLQRADPAGLRRDGLHGRRTTRASARVRGLGQGMRASSSETSPDGWTTPAAVEAETASRRPGRRQRAPDRPAGKAAERQAGRRPATFRLEARRRAGWPRSAWSCSRTRAHGGKIARGAADERHGHALGVDPLDQRAAQDDAAGVLPRRRRPQGAALRQRRTRSSASRAAGRPRAGTRTRPQTAVWRLDKPGPAGRRATS